MLVTVPLYIYPDTGTHSEPCLLGTNVAISLKLMVPHTSLSAHPVNPVVPFSHPVATAKIQLIKAARTPASARVVADAIMDAWLPVGMYVVVRTN